MANLGTIGFDAFRVSRAVVGGISVTSTAQGGPYKSGYGIISGTLQVDGVPQAAQIDLFTAAMVKRGSTWSLPSGAFRFDGLPPGLYIAVAQGHGRFKPKTVVFDVAPYDLFKLNFDGANESKIIINAVSGRQIVNRGAVECSNVRQLNGHNSGYFSGGVNDYLMAPSSLRYCNLYGCEAWEVGAFVRRSDSPGSAQKFIATLRTPASDFGFTLSFATQARFIGYFSGTPYTNITGGPTIQQNEWAKIVARKRGPVFELLVNDVVVGANTNASGGYPNVSESAGPLWIGVDPQALDGSSNLAAFMNEFWIRQNR